eukprot:3735919-Pleurochrysis_carterae.AAC.1
MGAAQTRKLGRAWAVAQGRGAQRAGAAIASVVPRAWGAERERSARATIIYKYLSGAAESLNGDHLVSRSKR